MNQSFKGKFVNGKVHLILHKKINLISTAPSLAWLKRVPSDLIFIFTFVCVCVCVFPFQTYYRKEIKKKKKKKKPHYHCSSSKTKRKKEPTLIFSQKTELANSDKVSIFQFLP